MSGLLGSQLPTFAIAALVLVVAVIAAIFVVRRGGKRARAAKPVHADGKGHGWP